MILLSSLLTCLALLHPSTEDDKRDSIMLWSGERVYGRVLLESADKILVLVGTLERWIARDQIANYDTVARSHHKLLDDLRLAQTGTDKDLLDLALRCQKEKLVHEAQLLFWRVLLLEPHNLIARKALGHRKRRKVWQAKEKGEWRSFRTILKKRSSWNDAWDLRSEHFQVRCDTGLKETLNTLFELEYFYDTFYKLFQRDLGLRQVIDPIQVYVYRNKQQFPALSDNVEAWFSKQEQVLYTWLQDDGHPFRLFHEATHALLHQLGHGSTRGMGNFPGWLDEGWAEYMQTIMIVERPGCADLRVGWVNQTHVDLLYRHKDPYGLHRLLNFRPSDFAASTKQILKYAQCYALFAHLLDGSKEKYRPRFLGYLRESLDGKGQASTFRNIFAKDLESIERLYMTSMGLRWK